MNMKRKIYIVILCFIILGFLLPQSYKMPVQNATKSSFDQKSFWYYPWGKSVTHKGVDIFAKKGTPIHSATSGIVLFQGQNGMGGNVVFVLGPKWRVHYYAHLDSISTHLFSFVSHNSMLGTVGATGNAAGKPPHLHYHIMTLIPYLWRIDNSVQGWKKIFYLNPIDYINESLGE
jgi:peptidoglycan LD-endopeptidase LytH